MGITEASAGAAMLKVANNPRTIMRLPGKGTSLVGE